MCPPCLQYTSRPSLRVDAARGVCGHLTWGPAVVLQVVRVFRRPRSLICVHDDWFEDDELNSQQQAVVDVVRESARSWPYARQALPRSKQPDCAGGVLERALTSVAWAYGRIVTAISSPC